MCVCVFYGENQESKLYFVQHSPEHFVNILLWNYNDEVQYYV